jgi:acyl dehydratase
VRWTAPVRPGDTLRCRIEVLSLKESRSKPDRGTMVFKLTALNQHGTEVMNFRSTCMLRKRPAAAG